MHGAHKTLAYSISGLYSQAHLLFSKIINLHDPAICTQEGGGGGGGGGAVTL